MAALSEIIGVARDAAFRVLQPVEILDVRVEPSVGSEGEDILRILIVVPDGQFDMIDGDHFLRTLSQIGKALEKAGDDRFAVVSYITPSELTSLDDAES